MANSAKTNSNFKVTIHSTTGACDTGLFKKMCERGDLNSTRIKDAVGDISSRPIHINQFVDIQMLYGVSIDALMYKAMKLEMIPQSRYVRYRQRKNKDARFKQIIDESRIGDEKSDRFESLVYKAYAGDIISLSKAASLLQVPESDIRQVYV